MNKAADHPQMLSTIAVISPIEEDDAGARAHTRTRNAIAHDIDRIEAARLAADRLAILLWRSSGWSHYCNSVGSVISERA